MPVLLNDVVPDFSADTTQGPILFHEWIADQWVLLVSHPRDFTPVCTTELAAMVQLSEEFARRDCKLIGLSIDPLTDHDLWLEDVAARAGRAVDFPVIADENGDIARLYGMLPSRRAGEGQPGSTARAGYLIGPDKRLRLQQSYPACVGRNFAELLRALDAIQLAEAWQVETPAGWQPGDEVLIAGELSDAQARSAFPAGWRAEQPYLRVVPQPGD
ncbi:peroxiredoxin [Granulosicoccaceae sp. 1_MG-2023]|nr:peroxiredoxin [Granulosicoccaceae sp. 1_MG-2023]